MAKNWIQWSVENVTQQSAPALIAAFSLLQSQRHTALTSYNKYNYTFTTWLCPLLAFLHVSQLLACCGFVRFVRQLHRNCESRTRPAAACGSHRSQMFVRTFGAFTTTAQSKAARRRFELLQPISLRLAESWVSVTCRPRQFRYFLILSIIKNDFFAFFIKLITYFCTSPI